MGKELDMLLCGNGFLSRVLNKYPRNVHTLYKRAERKIIKDE